MWRTLSCKNIFLILCTRLAGKLRTDWCAVNTRSRCRTVLGGVRNRPKQVLGNRPQRWSSNSLMSTENSLLLLASV